MEEREKVKAPPPSGSLMEGPSSSESMVEAVLEENR